MPRNPCVPAPCPPPAISDSPSDPYCPGWTSQLTSKPNGAPLILNDGCLYKLRSRCSGFLSFDRDTEEVTVKDPRLVSAVPRETRFGFIAKVVPTVKPLCPETGDDCLNEVRQELASQIVGLATCGELAILTGPSCGELPAGEDADAARQVRIDAMNPADGTKECLDGFHFLGFANSTITAGNTQTVCRKWIKMPRIKLRLSAWKKVKSDSADAVAGLNLVLVKVSGGTDTDPCYELRAMDGTNNKIPDGTDCGDTISWDAVNKKYVKVKAGLRFFPLEDPQLLVSSPVSQNVTFAEFPTPACADGPIFARVKFLAQAFAGPSSSPGVISCFLNATSAKNRICHMGVYGNIDAGEVSIKIAGALNSINFPIATGDSQTFELYLMGYEYGG